VLTVGQVGVGWVGLGGVGLGWGGRGLICGEGVGIDGGKIYGYF
jgi:hypothetical protein